MAKFKFKDGNWKELVQDVKVNGTSAFNGEIADIKLKTINNQDITGTGNIAISGGMSTDVQINGTSIVVNDVANILTESAYSSSNKIATVNDIPTDTGDLTNNAGFITGITSGDVTTALGYTPYNSSNPSDYQENVIETVKVNGTALTVTSKEVDIIVPTDTNDLTNSAGFITGITSVDVTTALGYTPYDSSNPEGYTSNVGTVTDVQINGTSIVTSNVANFLTETAYSSNNKIATINDIPTDTNELTNSAGFITSSDLSGYATETWVGNQGYITGITSNDVTTALGFTPYNATNPDGFITGITSTDVTTALGYTPLANLNQSITVLSGTSITLADNSINTLTPTGNITFTLPTVTDTTIFHQILVQLNLSTVYTIDLGTTTYFGGTAPDLSATGNYNLIYEYDNALSAWVVGAVNKV